MNRLRTIIFLILLLPNLSFAQQLVWKHTGGPMGGIIGDIAINSKGDIYAGAYPSWIYYSGLYKSTDNGDSWNKVETQFEDFQVYAIYITKEDHIWVGTNFQGKIYRSTDNGQTWENKSNGYNSGECWAFGESKDGVLFAGDGQYVNLYRSTDNGENWKFSANLRPLVFATDSNNIVYAGTHDGLFATTDNGLTWAENNFFSNIPVSTVLIDTNNNIYSGTGYYDNGDGIFYSTDSGQSWKQFGLAGKIVLSLAFDSEGNLYAGTKQNGLYKTTDMGQTWIQYNEGLYRKEVFRLKLNKEDDLFIGSENEGVFRSTNGGNIFEQIGLPISNSKNISFYGDSLIFASTPSGVQKFNRFTKEWTNLGLQDVYAVDLSPSGIVYAATFAEGLYKSTDLGKTWSLTNLNIDSLMSVYNVLAVSNDTVFAATEFNLRKSTDGGFSWTILPIKTGFFSRGMFLNNNDIWVTGFGISNYVLYKSSDGISFDSTFYGFNWSLNNCISGTKDGVIFIADPGFDDRGLFRSTDNGINWSQQIFSKKIWSVYSDDSGLVLGGGKDSLWYSSDFGSSWLRFSLTLKEYNRVIDIKKDLTNQLFFSTDFEGIFEIDIITNIGEEPVYSYNYSLSQNYPNPFNPVTKIKYSVPGSEIVKIKVYDVLGSEIAVLVNEEKSAGTYEVDWDASRFSSGVYFYQLNAGSFIETKKMILLR